MSGSDRQGDTEAAALTRLSAARTRLVLERPFLGALILSLPLQARGRCRSLATDARSLYFNPAYVLSLAFAEVQFMLAHQALHCALGHFTRRGARPHAKWDRACDYAVNGLLIDDGMKAPPDAAWSPVFRGLSAEEIYPLLPQAEPGATLDEHWFGVGQGGDFERRSADRPEVEEAFLEAHRDCLDEVGFQ